MAMKLMKIMCLLDRNSVWDDEAGFDAPAIINTHKDQSKHSQDHPGRLAVLGIVQLIQTCN